MVLIRYYFKSRFFEPNEINKADIYLVHTDEILEDGNLRYPDGNLDGEKLKKLLITQQNYEKIYSKIMTEKINEIYERVKDKSGVEQDKLYHPNTFESESVYKLSYHYQPGSEIHTHVNLLFDNTISDIIQEERKKFIRDKISIIEKEINKYTQENTKKRTATFEITGESGTEGNRYNVDNEVIDNSEVDQEEIEKLRNFIKDFVARELAILSMTRIETEINKAFNLKIEKKDLLATKIETKKVYEYEGGNKKKYRRKRKTTKRNKKTKKRKNKTKKRKRN